MIKEIKVLVLSRRTNESLHFFVPMPDGTKQEIIVQVVGTGKLVKLGILADKSVTVLREELINKKEK